MPDYFPGLDNDELADWGRVVESDLRWTGILLGNGASRAVWDAFSYPSLYDRARSEHVGDPLQAQAQDEALFDEFNTRNFESTCWVAQRTPRPPAASTDRLTWTSWSCTGTET